MSAFNGTEAEWIAHLLKDTMRARNLWVWEGKLEAMPGSHIDGACRELTWLSQLCGLLPKPLSIDFNGIEIVADGRNSADLVAAWRAESDRRRDAYLASPEYAEAQAKLKADREVAEALAIAAVAGRPTPDWGAIKNGTIEYAKSLGMGQWDSSEMPLMLFPKEWHGFALRTPGLEVETINGDRKVVGRDYIDDDYRYGMLAYGLRLRPRMIV